MPVKPTLMADIRNSNGGHYGNGSGGGRGDYSPLSRHRENIGVGNYNRFAHFSPRKRILSSGKRQLSPDIDSGPPFSKAPRLDPNKLFEQLGENDKFMEAAKVALSAAHAALSAACKPDDGGTGTALFKLGEVCENLIKSNEAFKSTIIDYIKVSPSGEPQNPIIQVEDNDASNGFGSFFKNRYANRVNQQIRRASTASAPPPSATEIHTAKVKKTLREAERKTVVFDLNLGTAPTINKETISKKVTVALHDKAREGNHDYALNDACEMVDDTLSCSMLEFMGNGTKKYYNRRDNNDPKNGKMCTVPVRFDFKNKETRIQAENTLRNICKVSCSVPYPKKLRTLLATRIAEGKKIRSGCFIRNRVDIDNLKIVTSARAENGWEHLDMDIPIPEDILGNDTMEVSTNQSEGSRVS